VALPPAVFDDSDEAAAFLVRVNGVVLLVDGYNVTMLGWPGQPIPEQRARLVDALAELVARTGADVEVVFDGGTDASNRALGARRGVRVSFSPPGVEADDVVIARAVEVPAHRPVTVASNDRRVQEGARAAGANVISSAQLLAALRR
jgi:predicted RNA-binding protein with PIN domain